MDTLFTDRLAVKGTIVSYFPFRVGPVYKPELVPAEYIIPAGDPINNKFSITHIESAQRRAFMGELRGGYQTFLCPASEVCESIVADYFNSTIYTGYTEDGVRVGPALIWFEGILEEPEILTGSYMNQQKEIVKYSDVLKVIFDNQVHWFKRLVNEADDLWKMARTHRSITDLQRFAATYLRLDREWLTELEIRKTNSLCPRCGITVPLTAAECSSCHYILDIARWNELDKQQQALRASQKSEAVAVK